MAYGSKQYDDDRADARYRAKRDLSPSEFNDWESNVAKGGSVRVSPFKKAKMPGQASESDDLTTALGRDLGFEKSEYKGTPQYDDSDGDGVPTKLASKGPGIYVPEGGAFGGGRPDKQIAAFDTPQETLRKKFEPRLSKMSADEKEIEYRKAKGMEVPAALALRRKLTGVQDLVKAASDFAPMPGQARSNTFTSNNSRPDDDFISGVMKNLGGDDDELTIGPRKGPLEQAADRAPAVAFNGRGPTLPGINPTESERAHDGLMSIGRGESPIGAARMPGQSMQDAILRSALKEQGIDMPAAQDPRKLQREDDEYNFQKEQRTMQRELAQLKLEEARAVLAEKKMTPGQRARANIELKRLEKEAMLEGETETEKLLREAEQLGAQEKVQNAQARLKGEVTQDQLRQANSRSRDAYRQMYSASRSSGASHEDAQRMALEDINSERRDAKLPPLTTADFGGDRKIVDMRPQTLQGIAQKAGADDTEDLVDTANAGAVDKFMKKEGVDDVRGTSWGDAAKNTLMNVVNPAGAVAQTAYFIGKALSPRSKEELLKDPEFLKTQKGRAISNLVSKGMTPEQAEATYDTYSFKK